MLLRAENGHLADSREGDAEKNSSLSHWLRLSDKLCSREGKHERLAIASVSDFQGESL